jgi:NADH dehydrogenase
VSLRIVVLGGTGFVGHSICEQLVRQIPGVRVVVPTRRPRFGLTITSLPGVELPTANVHDDAALRRVLAGADAVVNLVAILHGTVERFEHTHVALPQRLAKACHDLSVGRVVHVSAAGVSEQAPSMYLRSKARGEAALSPPGPVQASILRPSVIFGARDRFTNLFARMQSVLPLVPLAGAEARFQPVWVDDVARAAVQLLLQPQAAGQPIECCGPVVYTLGDLVRLVGRLAGHERPVIPLPLAVGRVQAALMGLLPGEPLMSGDNLDSMQVPSVATPGAPGLQALGITPAAMEAVLPQYLGPLRGDTRLDRWRAQR